MGRRPTKNLNLPRGMRARVQRSGRTFYYYDMGGKPRKEIPLGADYVEAVRKWAEFEGSEPDRHQSFVTFRYAAERYVRIVLPTKALRTRTGNLTELSTLYEFFDNPPALLHEISPVHIRQYLTWRVEKARKWYLEKGRVVPDRPGTIRANREISLFSHIFNFSREQGLTDAANPCVGVRRHSEPGRTVYVEDDVYARVWAVADEPTRDAMDLAYLTGQRPADALKFDERDIRDGELWVVQNKGGKRLRISITGELAAVIDRIAQRKAACLARRKYVVSTALIVNQRGERMTSDSLRSRFDKAREKAGVEKNQFQFRDLRAKAGTDKADSAGDIRAAQLQLGHKSLLMTEHYVRERKGDRVAPTK